MKRSLVRNGFLRGGVIIYPSIDHPRTQINITAIVFGTCKEGNVDARYT